MKSGHTLINDCTVKELKMTKQSSCIIIPLEWQNTEQAVFKGIIFTRLLFQL